MATVGSGSWWQRRPIFWQVFTLVIVAVLLTAGAMLALTFLGPPPRAAPSLIEDIAARLQNKPDSSASDRPMTLALADAPPLPRAGEERARWLEAALYPMLTVAGDSKGPSRLIAYASESAGAHSDETPRDVRGTVTIGWQRADKWRVLRSHSSPTETQWLISFGLAVTGVLAVILACAWFVVRAIAGPLSALADAAESARVGQPWSGPAVPSSPEIAKLAAALASFDARQRDHVRQQTTMLAGIAHDLGTPLTRLAFRTEGLDDLQREAANSDIALMRSLIGNSLALARSSMARSEPVDMHKLLHNVVASSWQEHAPLQVTAAPGIVVQGEPVALQRLVQNVVDNLQRHAGGGLVSLSEQRGIVILRAEDCGPGFPEELLGQLGSPFVRAEPSRNAMTGGHGLGLAIARTIAERHGGGLTLGNRTEGGAWVEVQLARRT